jgi:phosphotransferase family enzyme
VRAELPVTYGRGVRLPYAGLPEAVRSWVEEQLGGPVTGVEDRVGGFAPGCAAVLRSGERSVFCKATGSAANALAVELYRGERSRLAALPDHPALPKPLAAADLALPGQVWVVTLLPAIPGEPPAHPWTEPVARLVFDRWGELAATLATSVDGTPSALPGSADLVAFFGRWAEVVADPDDPWRQQPWVRDSLGRLRAADERVQEELVGTVPAHTDLRADNVLVGTAAGTEAEPPVWFVDWAAALTAAPWVDPAILACDLVTSRADRSQGGTMDVAAFLASHPVTAAVEPGLRWGMMLALAATLHRFSRQPAPPGLPTLRGWQHRGAEDLLAFVRAADLGSSRPSW